MLNLKYWRKNAGLTIEELGSKLALSKGTISMYENHKREPDIKNIIKISEILNITTDELLGVSIKKEPLPVEEDSTLTTDQKGIIALAKKLPPKLANKAYGYLLGLIDATSNDSDINKII